MGNWKIIEPSFVHNVYLVSNQIASNPQNTFYGKWTSGGVYPLDMDSPWFLIAVLSVAGRKDCFTLQLCSLDADLHQDLKSAQIDPLNSHYVNPFMSWSKEDLNEVIEILSTHSTRLEKNTVVSSEMFEEMDQPSIENLKQPPFNKEGLITKFYLQKYNPILGHTDDPKITMIRTNINLKKRERNLTFGIHEFDKEALDHPKSPYLKILDTAIGRINLDQNGALELCNILRSQSDYL